MRLHFTRAILTCPLSAELLVVQQFTNWPYLNKQLGDATSNSSRFGKPVVLRKNYEQQVKCSKVQRVILWFDQGIRDGEGKR